ncbi:MAG: hypothetical protein Q9212_000673 [Teloschistes hypoglaucus]
MSFQPGHPYFEIKYPRVDYRRRPAPVKEPQNVSQQVSQPPDTLAQAFSAATAAIVNPLASTAAAPGPSSRSSGFQCLEPSAFADGQTPGAKSRKRKAEVDPPHAAPKLKKKKIDSIPKERRPRAKKPRLPPKPAQAKPAKLSQKNPLQTLVPFDIWHCIIVNSPLSLVFKIKDVSKETRSLLTDKVAVWQDVRHRTYGPDHPGPPVGITEPQYADLLVGFGCQDKHCDDKRARKVYWAFQRRWCTSCMRKNTVQEDSCRIFLDKYPELTKYLNNGLFDGWGHYVRIGVPDESLAANRAEKRVFLRTDIARLTQQIRTIEAGISDANLDSSDARTELIAAMKATNEKVVEKIKSIEEWAKTYKESNAAESTSKKQKKMDFFAAKALSMNPPIDRETLERMECFHAAVAAASEPSERAWKFMEKKLQAQRAKLEASLAKAETIEKPNQEHYNAILERRKNGHTAEQVAVLALAGQVLNSLVEGPNSIQVADEDFIRIALTRVYDLHEDTKGEEGHALLMDDAKMIVKIKMEPIIKGWEDGMRKKAALSLRCPGCKKGSKSTHTFEKLIQHIFSKHSTRIGDYDYFRFGEESPVKLQQQSTFDFLWCSIEWPRNLPILAADENAGVPWDLHASVEEHYSPPIFRPIESDLGMGAFDNRMVSDCCGSELPKVVNDIRLVLDRFNSIDIPDRFKTQIALEFATQRHTHFYGSLSPTRVLKDLQLMLLRKGFKGVFENLRCHVCCDEARKDLRNGYFSRSRKSLAQLSAHFTSEHSRHDWTRDMLELPTPQELLKELQQPSNHEAYAQFDGLFPSTVFATLDKDLEYVAAEGTTAGLYFEMAEDLEDSEYHDDDSEGSESAGVDEGEDMNMQDATDAADEPNDTEEHEEEPGASSQEL